MNRIYISVKLFKILFLYTLKYRACNKSRHRNKRLCTWFLFFASLKKKPNKTWETFDILDSYTRKNTCSMQSYTFFILIIKTTNSFNSNHSNLAILIYLFVICKHSDIIVTIYPLYPTTRQAWHALIYILSPKCTNKITNISLSYPTFFLLFFSFFVYPTL